MAAAYITVSGTGESFKLISVGALATSSGSSVQSVVSRLWGVLIMSGGLHGTRGR